MKRVVLPFVALPLLTAAAQQRGLSLAVPAPDGGFTVFSRPAAPASPTVRLQPAPLPNRDYEAPGAGTDSSSTSVSPSLFTRSDQYRGEGFTKGSTAQSDQDRRVRPGAGFSLKMPLTPN